MGLGQGVQKKDVTKVLNRIVRALDRRAKYYNDKSYDKRQTKKILFKHIEILLNEERARYVPKRVKELIKSGHPAECRCCGSIKVLTFDHIKPTSKGGRDILKNGQILCERCNGLKDDKEITIKELIILIQRERNNQ